MPAPHTTVAAAQQVMGCRKSTLGPWCISHSHLVLRDWVDRGCTYAVAVADAVAAVYAVAVADARATTEDL